MDDNQSVLRKRRMDNEAGQDFISDLPLSIIHCILGLVPIRDAVKTCILARQWRYKWASLPRLVFDDDCVNQEGKSNNIVKKRLKNFITNALFLHKGPIHTFKLHVKLLRGYPVTDRWLLWLSRNEIREFSLAPRDFDGTFFRVHSSLYSCQKLTCLKLNLCEMPPPPPTFKVFSCLRSIYLYTTEMPSEAIESLVAKSPLLESFTYAYVGSSLTKFKISSPKLSCFELIGDFKEIGLFAPLVVKVTVVLCEDHFSAEQLQKSSVCNYTEFLGGCTNLESLKGHRFFTKYLSIGIESYGHSLVFHRLKIILLDTVNLHVKKEFLVVVRLIMGAPNLQELKLIGPDYITEYASKTPHASFKGFECTPNFTFSKLRVIKIIGIRDLPYEKELLKFLLKSSPVLETVTLLRAYGLPTEVMLNLTTELLRYRRASPDAEILFMQS